MHSFLVQTRRPGTRSVKSVAALSRVNYLRTAPSGAELSSDFALVRLAPSTVVRLGHWPVRTCESHPWSAADARFSEWDGEEGGDVAKFENVRGRKADFGQEECDDRGEDVVMHLELNSRAIWRVRKLGDCTQVLRSKDDDW